jgi:hypothetical protein
LNGGAIGDDQAPEFWISEMPEGEQDAAWVVLCGIRKLQSYCRDFAFALLLFKNADQLASASPYPQSRNLISEWKVLAARDGAMTIYHFGKAMEGIRSSLNETPTTKAKVDHGVLREATKKFNKLFPLYEDIRHAIAHSAELTRTTRAHKKNAFSGSFRDKSVFLEDVTGVMLTIIDDTSFKTTFEGAVISYSVTKATLQSLHEVRRDFWRGFQNRSP